MSWKKYYEKRFTEARPEVLRALTYLPKTLVSPWALDLGCGHFVETCYLAFEAPHHFMVEAVDPDPTLMQYYLDNHCFAADQVFFENIPIEDYPLDHVDCFSFACANYSLPWVRASYMPTLFNRLYTAMEKDGIVAFQLFGPKHTWNDKSSEASFYIEEEVRSFCEKFTTLVFEERTGKKKYVSGSKITEHVFDVILKK
jgi:trans-aconitate methyltransferase